MLAVTPQHVGIREKERGADTPSSLPSTWGQRGSSTPWLRDIHLLPGKEMGLLGGAGELGLVRRGIGFGAGRDGSLRPHLQRGCSLGRSWQQKGMGFLLPGELGK